MNGSDLTHPFRWPKRSREAAALLARGETWPSVQAQLGIGERTLARWHREPAFQAAIEDDKQAIAARIRAEGIANKQNRIDAYNERWTKQQQVIAARAADTSMSEQAGARTGLLVRSFKQLGSGEEATTVEEYTVDTGLLREMRELEKQAAQEVGDWDVEQTATVLTQKLYIGIQVERI